VVVDILKGNSMGLELGRLETLVNQRMPGEFDCVTFGYETFYNFIQENLSEFVEVQVRYMNKRETRYIIHLRHERFGRNGRRKLGPDPTQPSTNKEAPTPNNISSSRNNLSSNYVSNRLYGTDYRGRDSCVLLGGRPEQTSIEGPILRAKLGSSNPLISLIKSKRLEENLVL